MPPRRITVFGSSTVYGTADDEMGGFVQRLRLWHEARDPQNRVYNLGIWGEQTSALCERIASEAQARQPHLILIYAGFNDSRRVGSAEGPNATPIDAFAQLLRELLSAALGVAPTAVMTGYPFDEERTQPYPGTPAYYRLEDALLYNQTLTDVAESLEVKVIDFFGHFRNTDMRPLLASDGLHGNAACHHQLFELTRQFLEREYA